jgi:hypothetical protein
VTGRQSETRSWLNIIVEIRSATLWGIVVIEENAKCPALSGLNVGEK